MVVEQSRWFGGIRHDKYYLRKREPERGIVVICLEHINLKKDKEKRNMVLEKE